ncbi:progranulin-like [Stegodyphus dumicola]|uniref:progranulin-like n=1 Tax=Stegodyphus dumicola TaxID=202533 RepID=UPI0015AA80CF|nr:progranulin-like [Stegodyphus dumicola]XP_035222048.1 progranulin-like [Stegodyphus dumicola]XP_035222049.1 progranulin-like [Stegodyphus dumicola]XP_035222050.1 progranulin-like [Stegodyphus dumicola]XP_035222051.1 progranulin-like [Stegodyphus dumicola]XP_035222052.1 progranulin-like [Stegodyphus dumicola]
MNVWFVLFAPAVLAVQQICPGGSYSCPDLSTCCQLIDKSYGCCPLANAVCCDDHIHCCPKGTKCSTGLCIQSLFQNITAEKYMTDNSIIHPKKTFVCPDDTTCCKGTGSDNFGYCPVKDGICCNDGKHCCPQDTVCDLSQRMCIGKGYVSKMYDSDKNHIKPQISTAATMKTLKVSNIICPGSTFQCPNGYTCCKLPSGNWGCCPFVKATCCKDHLHCCPENMQCSPTSDYCTQGQNNVTAFLNKPAVEIEKVNTLCPDKSECQEGMTCCKLDDIHFGCCQYENATCCADKKHCCPSNFNCDILEERCVPKQKENWMLKFMSKYLGKF